MSNTTGLNIQIPHDAISKFCKRWGLAKLEVFGSAVRDDFNLATSDVDLLMTIRPNPPKKLSLMDVVRMEGELATIFGRKVDLLTRRSVEQHYNEIRKRSILEHTETIYVAP